MPKFQAHHYVTIVYDFEVEADDHDGAIDVAFDRMVNGEGLFHEGRLILNTRGTSGQVALSEALAAFGWEYADVDDDTYVEPEPLEVA